MIDATQINFQMLRALKLLVGNNPVQSLCRHGFVDMMGRAKGTWGTEAEAAGRAALKLAEDAVELSTDTRARMAFYEQAMKDPVNHPAMALELAYLRATLEGQKTP